MNRVARVLVFPCGSEIGLEIHRAISGSTFLHPVGATSVASNHGRMFYRDYIEGVPFVNDPALVPALNAIIERHGIDLIYPAHDDIVTALAARDDLLCGVVGSPAETCNVCRSKRRTYDFFRALLPTPAVYAADGDYPLPVFLKPECGQGSRGVMLAHSRAQVESQRERDPSLMLLEYLPGAEYTVDCFTDSNRQLRFAGVRERLRTVNGISVHTKPAQVPELEAMAETINNALPLRGAWFFQAKRAANGTPTLLEVAPRVSGGMGMFRAAGVNLPLLGVFDALGFPVEILRQDFEIDSDRALTARYQLGISYTHAYIDYDDTLVMDGALNPQAIAFVAQCRAKQVKVHLLSRHAGDLESALQAWGIRGLFDAVHHLGRGERKSAFITQADAIFIDDSFTERKEVHRALGIPVFAVDAIEALMDGRA